MTAVSTRAAGPASPHFRTHDRSTGHLPTPVDMTWISCHWPTKELKSLFAAGRVALAGCCGDAFKKLPSLAASPAFACSSADSAPRKLMGVGFTPII